MALRVLSNIAELRLDDPALCACSAIAWPSSSSSRRDRALFEEVLRLRPEEPQSHRDLALVLGRRAKQKRFGGGRAPTGKRRSTTSRRRRQAALGSLRGDRDHRAAPSSTLLAEGQGDRARRCPSTSASCTRWSSTRASS
jgi:hypothetical protein